MKRPFYVDEPRSQEATAPTRFDLNFSLDNAAFEDTDRAMETARILRAIADKLESGRHDGSIMDANGNNIGAFSLSR